jgi:hypothetical protein
MLYGFYVKKVCNLYKEPTVIKVISAPPKTTIFGNFLEGLSVGITYNNQRLLHAHVTNLIDNQKKAEQKLKAPSKNEGAFS